MLEINITLQEDGSWVATSPDYPGWSFTGEDIVGAAYVAARELERATRGNPQ